MLFKLISCNVFLREACLAIAHSPHRIDPEFFELGEHARPDRLRQAIQARIDATEEAAKPYDAVLLLYGLCGNAGAGLRARQTRLVIPRAHDCCSILLGSKDRFREHFGNNPSTAFSSVGYMERGQYFLRSDLGDGRIHYGDQFSALVEQYGEDNAKYIWESMHPEGLESSDNHVVYIDIPETSRPGYERQFRDKAESEGKHCRSLAGDITLIRRLLDGQWDLADFLIVEPGHETAGVYDWNEVIRARPVDRG